MDRRKLLLLDTGPLWELITFKAAFDLGFRNLRKNLLVSEKSSYEKFSRYIGSFQIRSTTAAVIVELDRRVRDTSLSGRRQMWSLIYDEFRDMGMEEEIVKLPEMPLGLVARYGPTDVGLLRLAQRHVQFDPVVLTIDQEFHSECLRARIRAVQVHEVIGGWV